MLYHDPGVLDQLIDCDLRATCALDTTAEGRSAVCQARRRSRRGTIFSDSGSYGRAPFLSTSPTPSAISTPTTPAPTPLPARATAPPALAKSSRTSSRGRGNPTSRFVQLRLRVRARIGRRDTQDVDVIDEAADEDALHSPRAACTTSSRSTAAHPLLAGTSAGPHRNRNELSDEEMKQTFRFMTESLFPFDVLSGSVGRLFVS